jgi:hypothetical protein
VLCTRNITKKERNKKMTNELSALLARIRSGFTTADDEKPILEMVNALDFYATQTNYLPFDAAGHTPVDLDNGEKARDALGL